MENIFKSKLENYSEQPPQAVWNKIQEKRTPLYIWWNAFRLRGWKYAASILLILVSAVGLYVSNSHQGNVELMNKNKGVANQNEIVLDKVTSNNDNLATSPIESNTANTVVEIPTENSKSIKTPINKNIAIKVAKKVKISGEKFAETNTPKSEINSTNTEKQRNVFDRLFLNRITIASFLNSKAYQFYPNLLPYSELSTTVINIIEPNKDNTNERPSNWYAQMSVGPMLATRSIKGEGALKEIRDNSEKARMGWNVNAKIGRSIGMHWELESGLQWMQRRENLNYNFSYSTLETSFKITDVKIYHPNLEPVYVRVVDTVYTMRNQTVSKNQTNTYNYLSIPIIARYNFYFPKSWSVNAGVGLLTDFYRTNKGEVMANNKESVAIQTIAKSNNFNQRILLSAGVKLKANQHWSILAEPVAIFGVNNMMTSTYSLKQKEFGLMLNTGLRYNF